MLQKILSWPGSTYFRTVVLFRLRYKNDLMKKLSGYLLTAFLALAGNSGVAQTITTFAGNGTYSFSGDGGPATLASLGRPVDVYVAASGSVYIVDQWNNRVRLVNSSGTISTIAGNGTTAWASEGVAATTVGIDHPRAICADASGNLYVADEGNERIRKITPGGLIYNAAGNGTSAYSGDGGPATSASIYGALGVCTDAGGNLYIGDSRNYVVRKVTPAGIISTFAGNGVAGSGGDGGPATAAQFTSPSGLCFDAAGNLYVADYWRVRKITPAGIITTFAGNGTLGYSGDGGPATAAAINNIVGICLDATGNLYIADQGNNVVRKVTTAGIISTYAGTGTAGFSGDGGPAAAARLNEPTGVRMDGSNNLYIADYSNQRIRKVFAYNVAVGNTGATNVAVNVYPNPASTTIFVDCGQPINAQISGLDGRILLTQDNVEKVDISHLTPGNYLLHILDPATGANLYNKVITRE